MGLMRETAVFNEEMLHNIGTASVGMGLMGETHWNCIC